MPKKQAASKRLQSTTTNEILWNLHIPQNFFRSFLSYGFGYMTCIYSEKKTAFYLSTRFSSAQDQKVRCYFVLR